MSEDKDDRVVWLKVGLPEKLRNRFKSITASQGLSMNEVISDYVKKYIEEGESETKKSSSDNK